MRVTLLFVFFYFLIPGGFNGVYAVTQNNTIVRHTLEVKTINPLQDFTVIRDADRYSQEASIISDNMEDEEDLNNLIARKYRLLPGHHSTFSSLLRLSDLHSCFNALQPYCSHFSCKYSTQRALRI